MDDDIIMDQLTALDDALWHDRDTLNREIAEYAQIADYDAIIEED